MKQRIKKIFKSKKTKVALALIVALAVIIFWKQFSALAQSVIDSFTDTNKVADTWNVTVDTGTGKAQLSEKSCDNSVWFCGTGYDDVCADTLGDGDHIIVKRTNETATQWKTSNTACDQPECSQGNLVADNTVNFADYPARQECKAIGGRLPTYTELQCIYNNRATFGDNFGTSGYWSATENVTVDAKYVSLSSGSVNNYYKTSPYSVRCVRGW